MRFEGFPTVSGGDLTVVNDVLEKRFDGVREHLRSLFGSRRSHFLHRQCGCVADGRPELFGLSIDTQPHLETTPRLGSQPGFARSTSASGEAGPAGEAAETGVDMSVVCPFLSGL